MSGCGVDNFFVPLTDTVLLRHRYNGTLPYGTVLSFLHGILCVSCFPDLERQILPTKKFNEDSVF
jgi:hypothetical protein